MVVGEPSSFTGFSDTASLEPFNVCFLVCVRPRPDLTKATPRYDIVVVASHGCG